MWVGMMNCCGVLGARRGYSLCMYKGRDAGNRQSEALWAEQGMKHRLDGEPMVTTTGQVRQGRWQIEPEGQTLRARTR